MWCSHHVWRSNKQHSMKEYVRFEWLRCRNEHNSRRGKIKRITKIKLAALTFLPTDSHTHTMRPIEKEIAQRFSTLTRSISIRDFIHSLKPLMYAKNKDLSYLSLFAFILRIERIVGFSSQLRCPEQRVITCNEFKRTQKVKGMLVTIF